MPPASQPAAAWFLCYGSMLHRYVGIQERRNAGTHGTQESGSTDLDGCRLAFWGWFECQAKKVRLRQNDKRKDEGRQTMAAVAATVFTPCPCLCILFLHLLAGIFKNFLSLFSAYTGRMISFKIKYLFYLIFIKMKLNTKDSCNIFGKNGSKV